MKPITDYLDYRLYMLDFFEERKNESGLSWRAFNKNAGFVSSSYLKLVCEGKTRLSKIGASQVCKAMELSKEQTSYFCAMVTYCDTTDESKKVDAYERMQTIAKDNKVRIVGNEAYDYYNSWWNPILRELAPKMPNALPVKIASMFYDAVTIANVRDSLDFMVNAGFLERTNTNSYKQTDKAIRGSSELIPKAIRAMHKTMAEHAAKAVENFPKTDRNFSGLTIPANRDTYEQIVNELNNCRKRIAEIVSAAEETDRIFRVNLQIFPVTKEIKK